MSWKTALVGIILLLILLAATKSESLWIDEGDTAYYAVQPNFSSWKSHLLTDTNADCQFPLYMLGIWAWEKLTGSSEYALRSLNAGFALLAIASLALIGRQRRFRYLWMLLLIQPFFWFYLNEARPYMLQLASGAILLAGFVTLEEKKGGSLGWGLFFMGTILLYYSTLLSFVTLGVFYTVVGLLVFREKINLPKKSGWWVFLLFLVLAPGGIYYLKTILRGVQGARIWDVSPLNLVWIYDEIIGGGGLGPPVWQIREIARSLIHSGNLLSAIPSFFLASILAVGIASAFILAAWNILLHRDRGRIYQILAAMLAFIVLSLAVISIGLKKAFWARHLSPVFPVYIVLLYGIFQFLMAKRRAIPCRILGFLLMGLLTYSSIRVVCSGTYSRDDYRGAARRAMTTIQKGENVWWAGSWHCGAFYGLPILEGVSKSPHLILVQDPTLEVLLSKPIPKVIMLSRPDVYDGKNTIGSYVVTHDYRQSDQVPYLFHSWEK